MSAIPWVKEAFKGAPIEELHHHKAASAQQVALYEHVSSHNVAKVVVVFADGRPLILVLPASHRVSMPRLKEALGVKSVRMAEEGDLLRLYPDCELGAEPPMPPGEWVDLWADISMRTEGDIVFSAGTQTDALRIPFAEWARRIRPKFANFAEEPGAPRGYGDS